MKEKGSCYIACSSLDALEIALLIIIVCSLNILQYDSCNFLDPNVLGGLANG